MVGKVQTKLPKKYPTYQFQNNLPEVLWLKLMVFYAKNNTLPYVIINYREGTANSVFVVI